jgi:hypothetical protein
MGRQVPGLTALGLAGQVDHLHPAGAEVEQDITEAKVASLAGCLVAVLISSGLRSRPPIAWV